MRALAAREAQLARDARGFLGMQVVQEQHTVSESSVAANQQLLCTASVTTSGFYDWSGDVAWKCIA